MRNYNSKTDYPILLEAVRSVGKAGGFLTAAAQALTTAGIRWPNLQGNSPEATAVDADCTRALGEIKQRLEYIRGELQAERISYDELHELQSLAACIDADDVQLLEAAGVPEFPDAV